MTMPNVAQPTLGLLKPLAGKTVLDLSVNLPGPYCTSLLERAGARVIKIESPKKGDPAAHLPGLYRQLNEGKEVQRVDISDPEQRKRLYAMMAEVDIVVEGARPGVAKKLGVDFDTLRAYTNRLIYCSISGYGQCADKANIPAHDINLQAESGLIGFDPNKIASGVCAIPIADLTASHYAYSQILAACLSQQQGQDYIFLDVSMQTSLNDMVDTWASTLRTSEDVDAMLNRILLTRKGKILNPLRRYVAHLLRQEPLSALPHYGVFKCKDGKWIALGIVDEQHFWQALCHALGGWLLRFNKLGLQQRILFSPLLRWLIKRKLGSKTSRDWLEWLGDLPVSLVK